MTVTDRVLVPKWEACEAAACHDPRRPDSRCQECQGEGVVYMPYWADVIPWTGIVRDPSSRSIGADSEPRF